MMRRRWSIRTVLLLSLAACNPFGPEAPKEDPDQPAVPDDVSEALKQLPDATVVQWTTDGLPLFIVGEMAKLGNMPDDMGQASAMLTPALPPILKPFRLTPDQLVAKKISTDEQGDHHVRYQQVHGGLPVIGGDLIVHVDVKGAIYSV